MPAESMKAMLRNRNVCVKIHHRYGSMCVSSFSGSKIGILM